VAAVELAVCLPLLVTVIFGGIQAANMIFLKQAIAEAAYEGALFGSKSQATQSATVSRIQTILNARNIQGTTITAGNSAGNINQLTPGDLFSIRITATASANAIGPQIFPTSGDVGSEIYARKL